MVPLLILIPALAQPTEHLAPVLALALAKAAVVLLLILFAGQKLMRGWFHVVARRRSNELFVLNVLLITLGLAWATELAGLSLALGAFLAGMLISETEYKHQVEEDIKPFRDLLLGLFFITIGMQLNVSVVADRPALVLLLFAAPVLFKFALIAVLSRMFGATPGNALRTALALAQAGEFGFVLLAQAGGVQLVDDALLQPILAAMLLSMLSAPFLIQYSDKLVLRFVGSEWMLRSLALHQIAGLRHGGRKSRGAVRLRPHRPEPGAFSRAGRHRLYRARPRSGARARGRCRRRERGVWRRRAARSPDCRGPRARQRAGDFVPGHTRRAEDPAPCTCDQPGDCR